MASIFTNFCAGKSISAKTSKYGDITDSVTIKDRATGRPRGFGFITYADPSVVNRVIAETHVINGKQRYAGNSGYGPPLHWSFNGVLSRFSDYRQPPYRPGIIDWELRHYDGSDGGGSYESGAGSGYVRAGVPYGNRAGYSGGSGYNPYGM